jgi:hypothetical protein
LPDLVARFQFDDSGLTVVDRFGANSGRGAKPKTLPLVP